MLTGPSGQPIEPHLVTDIFWLINKLARPQNVLTHADSRGKTSMEVLWQAPADYQGDVVFKCTFVRDFSTFWVQVPANQRVRIARSAPAPPPVEGGYLPSPAPAPVAPRTTTTTTTTTTTLRTPIVSTHSWSFSTPAPSASASTRPSVYEGCGDIKGCFGMPAGCAVTGTCETMVTYSLKGLRYEFELWAARFQPNSYVAVGFSKDAVMGDDSVTDCSLINGQVKVHMSFNSGKSNTRLREPMSGLSDVQMRYGDGSLYCKFTRESPFSLQNMVFDLNEPHYLLLARGQAFDGGITYHDRSRSLSDAPVNLAQVGLIGANKNVGVKVHGAMMVAAWVCAASMGILFARYYRQTWVGKQFMGKDLWFVFHRVLMVTTWTLTMIAFIVIFIELKGWTSIPVTQNPHAVIGCITTALAFIQPIMAYFRPHPGTPKRFIFNWAHWLVGNSAHILGIVCVFLAVGLDKANLPDWANWLLVTYVAFHALTHLILSVAQCCYYADGSRKSTVFAMKDLAPHQTNQTHFYSTQQDRKEDAHGSTMRRLILAIYILVVIGLSAAFIGTIVTRQ